MLHPDSSTLFFSYAILLSVVSRGVPQVSISDVLDGLLNISHYDMRVRPGAEQGLTTNVSVDMTINSISYVDEVNMEYTVDLYFRSQWLDPRLEYNFSAESLVLGHSLSNDLWLPDLFFPDEKEATTHEVIVPNQAQRLWPNGTIRMSKRLSVKFACYMDIRMYPLDNQTCDIRIESYIHTEDELRLSWLDGTPLKLSPDLRLPTFSVISIGPRVCERVLTTGRFSCLLGELSFKRLSGVYFINSYLPAVLVVIMSWVAFWLDATSIAARISIGLLTVLTMTTQTTGVIGSLPKVSYIKAIEAWMCGCLLFVFVAFLETAVSYVMQRAKTPKCRKGQRIFQDGSASKLARLPAYTVSLESGLSSSGLEAEDWDGSTQLALHPGPVGRLHRSSVLSQIQKSICPAGNTIDRLSRALFPLVFGIFNLAYWIICFVS